MRMYDLITKKKRGGALSREELRFVARGCAADTIPTEQIAALLMAIWFRGMTDEETTALTLEMARSGEMMDLSALPGAKVDKHSTGGVGDKTTLVAGPIAAACGATVVKMSGRGLGHTGGTIDKLEAIPGLRTSLSREEFFRVARTCGIAVAGQSAELAPADKKLYAIRDLTATVDSVPLIASSVISKKLASGADAILLDVKLGSGAFMKTMEDALRLAEKMVAIGEAAGRRTAAVVTDMDAPLGRAVGNAIELWEAAETLRGAGPADLTEESLLLAAEMLRLAHGTPRDVCRRRAEEALASGAALEKLCAMVRAQGGDDAVLRDPSMLPRAPYRRTICAPRGGFIARIDAEAVGETSCLLGAGRLRLGGAIDPSAGILLARTRGERVEAGEPIATVFTSRAETLDEAEARLLAAAAVTDEPPAPRPLVYARVEKGRTQRYA